MLGDSPLRLLVVGNAESAVTGMTLSLQGLGHEALMASTADDALTQASTFRPDAFFIEIANSCFDGLSMAPVLRAMPDFRVTPLIAISKSADAEDRCRAEDAGFDEFLTRPCPPDELLGTLARVRQLQARGRQAVEQSQCVAQQTRLRSQASKQQLERDRRAPSRVCMPVAVEKSGISNIITLPHRHAAEELRRWLKEQRCRVGPVFEPAPGAFAFFVYSKRHCIRELIAKNRAYSL